MLKLKSGDGMSAVFSTPRNQLSSNEDCDDNTTWSWEKKDHPALI